MNLDRHDFETSPDFFEFEFYSEGPKGRIRKIVRFQPFTIDGEELFNLMFGDWKETTGSLEDMTTSNMMTLIGCWHP